MPVETLTDAKEAAAAAAGRLMLVAAVTAPKMGGIPVVDGAVVHGASEIEAIASKLEEIADERKSLRGTFLREARAVRKSAAVVFIGTYRAHDPFGTTCGRCLGDMGDVAGADAYCRRFVEAPKLRDTLIPGPVCSTRIDNLGYAVGSAMWIASRLFFDAKPKFQVGVAAMRLGYLPKCKFIVGIPLSATEKNPFGDVLEDAQHYTEEVASRVERIWGIFRSVHGNYGGD